MFRKDVFVEPKHDLRDRTLLVLPFREGPLWHYESARGEKIARRLALALQEDCDAILKQDDLVRQQVLENFEDPAPMDRWAQASGASHVVSGEILRVDFTRRSVIGMIQCTLEVRLEVWDAMRGERAYSEQITVIYPEDPSKETANVFEMSEEQVYDRTLARAVQQLAGLVCGYYEDYYTGEPK